MESLLLLFINNNFFFSKFITFFFQHKHTSAWHLVLDTNILLVSLSSKSGFRMIFNSFVNEEITLCVTTEILLKYEEIISKYFGKKMASTVLQLIENAPNIEQINTYFKWKLIISDPDDNKFVDCAIACDAKYLVSNDKHFNILKQLAFPKVSLLKIEEFKEILLQEQKRNLK